MTSLLLFLASFGINLAVVLIITLALYYPKSHRRDFCFTFLLMSISIFLMIYTLNDLNMKTGFAIGLFAIFSIMRFRTEQMPVRDMTYLFVIVAISVVNAMAGDLDKFIILSSNVLLIASIGISEIFRSHKNCVSKLVQYDRIDLIVPEKREELIADLEKRIGIKIVNLEVGHVDFLKDSAMLKVYYELEKNQTNTVDHVVKFPKPDKDIDDD